MTKLNKILLSSVAALTFAVSGHVMAQDDNHNHNHDNDGEHHSDMTIVETKLQYTGPIEMATISQIIKEDSLFNDQNYTLEGKIIRQVNANEYIFSDGQEELLIEMEGLKDVVFSNEDTVRITGEMESELLSESKFEVKKLTIL